MTLRQAFRVRVLLVLAVVVVVLALPTSSGSVVGGAPDGDRHPYVGMLAGYDEIGLYYICSGTLISPTVFVTAAHCLPGDPDIGFPAEIRITFDSAVPLESTPFGDLPNITTWVTGTTHMHPLFDGSRPFDATFVSYDMGVVVLNEPASNIFPDVTPAQLPPANVLERAKPGIEKWAFSLIGYGLQCPLRPQRTDGCFIDGTRRMAGMKNQFLEPPNVLGLRGEPNSSSQKAKGVGCSGDSGGGVLVGDVLMGVNSGGDFCEHYSFAARLDTSTARTFLASYVALP